MASNDMGRLAATEPLVRASAASPGGGESAAWIRSFATTQELPSDAPTVIRATPTQARVAIATVAIAAFVTLCILPFARVKGPALAGFVPAYQATVFLFYALTYVHVINHFRRTRIVALSQIAVGCLFSAVILLVQMFSFPIWGPVQLVGSTSATTTWLWAFWHIGPAMLTFGYIAAVSMAGHQVAIDPAYTVRRMVLKTLGMTACFVGIATGLSIGAVQWLPSVVYGDDYSGLITSGVGPAVLLLTLGALALLGWRTRCSSAVDLCLAVSLALLVFDNLLTLSGGSRLSVGWYAGRAEAAISAAILLIFYISDLDRRFTWATDAIRSMAEDRIVLNELIVEQRDANAALATQAWQDGLTGLANRRRLDQAIEQEWLRAHRENQTITVLMIDVDFFKLYNDYYGHQAGDKCLRLIGDLMKEVGRRPADLAARYGGEEFVLVLPDTDREGGLIAANALISLLAWRRIAHEASPLGRVTVSIGVASAMPRHGGAGPEELIAAADQALYQAKQDGRNQVGSVLNDSESEPSPSRQT